LMRWVHVDDSKLGMVDALKIPANLAQIWLNYTVSNRYGAVSKNQTPIFTLETNTPELAIAA